MISEDFKKLGRHSAALVDLGGYLAEAEFEWAKEKLILLLTPRPSPAPVSIGRVGRSARVI